MGNSTWQETEAIRLAGLILENRETRTYHWNQLRYASPDVFDLVMSILGTF